MVTEIPAWNVTRGDTFPARVTLWQDAGHTQPWDLTGAVLLAEVRQSTGSPVLATFQLTLTAPNIVDFLLDEDVTSTLPYGGAVPAWDLQATWPGTPKSTVRTLVRGTLKVAGDITDSTAAVRGVAPTIQERRVPSWM